MQLIAKDFMAVAAAVSAVAPRPAPCSSFALCP